jgi:hypothetical protein
MRYEQMLIEQDNKMADMRLLHSEKMMDVVNVDAD